MHAHFNSSCWKRENKFSRVWPMVGWPHSNGCPYTYECMYSTKQIPFLKKNQKVRWMGGVILEEFGEVYKYI